jgi:hypothetical protein
MSKAARKARAARTVGIIGKEEVARTEAVAARIVGGRGAIEV